MKKRLLAITAILTAVVGAIVLTLALLSPRPAVTKANFDRLENGMSVKVVESIFGGPCSEWIIPIEATQEVVMISEPRYQAWQGARGFASIQFNENGRIVRKTWIDFEFSLYQKLQRWLPWLPD